MKTSNCLWFIIFSDGGKSKEKKTQFKMSSSATTRLNFTWKRNIRFPVKIKLYKSLVIPTL